MDKGDIGVFSDDMQKGVSVSVTPTRDQFYLHSCFIEDDEFPVLLQYNALAAIHLDPGEEIPLGQNFSSLHPTLIHPYVETVEMDLRSIAMRLSGTAWAQVARRCRIAAFRVYLWKLSTYLELKLVVPHQQCRRHHQLLRSISRPRQRRVTTAVPYYLR